MPLTSQHLAVTDMDSLEQPPVRILVVEDEALVGAYIAEVLRESGFEVIGIASTGREALSIARDSGADIALVDITLAGPLDGIEVACFIRELFGIGAIFLSGTSDPEIVARAGRAQPYGFLRKPFRPGQMYNMLSRALGERAAAGASGRQSG
jgi:DNA-binding NarL/FixJ family response regulator